MERFETRIEDGTYAIEATGGWIEIGPIEEIVTELGEVYEVEYDEMQAAMPWLETDDGVLRIEVRETLSDISFDQEFVSRLSTTPREQRLDTFTDTISRIWDGKGDPDVL